MNDEGLPMDPGATDPLVASDSGTSHRLDQMLRRVHAELSPTSADKARGRAALGLPEPPASPSAPTGWAALRASGKTGAVVSVVSLGLAFGVGFWLGRAAPDQPTPSVAPASVATPALASADPGTDARAAPAARQAAPAPEGERAAAGRPPGEPTPRGTSPAHPDPSADGSRGADRPRDVAARSHTSKGAAAPAHDQLRGTSRSGEELALMRRIERALRNDQPGLALALLAEAEARFPSSALEEERLAASVMAHCGLRDPGYERRAETFLESRPRSVYRTRVMAACDGAAADEGNARRGDE